MNDIVQLRGMIAHHHVLIEGEDVHLLDGGFLGGITRIGRFLKNRGLNFSNIKSIVISHGHLDHTLNVTRIKELSGCQIYAPIKDEELIAGYRHYDGWNKIGGLLENLGANLLSYQEPPVDHWLQEGDVLEIFGGLEIVAFPGHTPGHCGFLLRDRKILFANDLFANQFGKATPPPDIFNDDHEEVIGSIIKASKLPIRSAFINHGRKESPEETFVALKKLAASLQV